MSGPAPAQQPGPLAGLAVLELGDGVAGAAAADILAALGAEVTTVTAADSLVRALHPQAGGTSVLAAVLDARKRAVSATGEAGLPVAADIVICDRVHRSVAALPALAADYLDHVQAHNRAAWVTVSAFGLGGPRADQFGSD